MKKEVCYRWEGISIDGSQKKGETKALNKESAIQKCQDKGIVITKIAKISYHSFGTLFKPKRSEMHFFIVQLKTMIESGMPLLDSLNMLSESSERKALKVIIKNIVKDMRDGNSFSKALSSYPQYFSSLFVSLVEVGEQTGKLDLTLAQLISYQELETELRQKVKKALAYPAVVFIVTCLIAGGLLVFVVPRFTQIFTSMHAQLPALTLFIVLLSDWIAQYWFLLVIFFSVVTGGIEFAKYYSKYCRILSARLFFLLPVIGRIFHQAMITRFSQTLTTLLVSGIPITQASQKAAEVTDNAYFIFVMEALPEKIAAGYSLSQGLENITLIPDLMRQMIKIGEETGEIAPMLEHISHHYLSILNASVEQLGQLLEPIFLFILGGFVGILVIALYLPIFDLMSVMR